MLKAAATYLLQGRIGESFDAIVTGVAPKGTFVRITAPMVEGRMVRGFEGLDVGDAVRVKLRSVDQGTPDKGAHLSRCNSRQAEYARRSRQRCRLGRRSRAAAVAGARV